MRSTRTPDEMVEARAPGAEWMRKPGEARPTPQKNQPPPTLDYAAATCLGHDGDAGWLPGLCWHSPGLRWRVVAKGAPGSKA